MSDNQPKIPDSDDDKAVPQESGRNFTSLKGVKGISLKGIKAPKLPDKKKFVVAATILIALILPIAGYFVYTSSLTTGSEAVSTYCGKTMYCAPPSNYDVFCPDNSIPGGGAIPIGQCKPANANTWKCRNSQGLEFFSYCNQNNPTPTPTPYVSQGCPPPTQCIPALDAAKFCNITNATQRCALPQSTTDGYCCEPETEIKCEPPRFCVPLDTELGTEICREGSIDDEGTVACHQESPDSICCIPEEPTPTLTGEPTPTETLTPTPTEEPTLTPTGEPTPTTTPPACVFPELDIEVECLTCGERVLLE